MINYGFEKNKGIFIHLYDHISFVELIGTLHEAFSDYRWRPDESIIEIIGCHPPYVNDIRKILEIVKIVVNNRPKKVAFFAIDRIVAQWANDLKMVLKSYQVECRVFRDMQEMLGWINCILIEEKEMRKPENNPFSSKELLSQREQPNVVFWDEEGPLDIIKVYREILGNRDFLL